MAGAEPVWRKSFGSRIENFKKLIEEEILIVINTVKSLIGAFGESAFTYGYLFHATPIEAIARYICNEAN